MNHKEKLAKVRKAFESRESDYSRTEVNVLFEEISLLEAEIGRQEQTTNELHDSAMDISEEAQALYRKALKLERQALERAAAILPVDDREPTFSILCSSAAWLAFKADLPNSAIELAERGLKEGNPSDYHRHGLEWVIEWSRRAIEEKG